MAKAEKKATFVWEGTDRKGNKTKGQLTGDSVALVKAELRKQGINAKKVRKKAEPFSLGQKKITPSDIAIFTRQLATMLKAGVPLVQSFDIVADGLDNPKLKNLVLDIKNEVSSGNSLANSIRKHPQYFDDLFCNLVHSGEQSGALEGMLDRIATYKEKTESLKKKVKKALSYPIAVVVVAVAVTVILLIYVVPQFEELFKGFGAELPAFTQMVINLSRFVQKWWYMGVGLIVAMIFGFGELKKRSSAFNDYLDHLVLKIPIIGIILEKSAIARYARTLATTFAAGVPLVEALDSVAGATGNVVFSNAVRKIREDVATGQQLQFSMRSTGVFPSMAVQMVAIGEESGALDTMLDKVATHYEEEVDNAVDSLTSLLEPMIMSVLGVVVGGLIAAMYLPIFKLGSVV